MFFDFFRNKDFLKSISSRELGYNPSEYYRYSTNDNYFLKKVLDSISISNQDKIIDVRCEIVITESCNKLLICNNPTYEQYLLDKGFI